MLDTPTKEILKTIPPDKFTKTVNAIYSLLTKKGFTMQQAEAMLDASKSLLKRAEI